MFCVNILDNPIYLEIMHGMCGTSVLNSVPIAQPE